MKIIGFVLAVCMACPALAKETASVDTTSLQHWQSVGSASAPAISGDGRWVAYGATLPTAADDTLAEGQLDHQNAADGTPARFRHAGLFVGELGRRDAQPMRIGTAFAWSPSWSPDQRTVAYYSNEGGAVQLWVYNVGTKAHRRVSDARIYVRSGNREGAVWSRDGRKLYVPIVTSTTGDTTFRPNPYGWDRPVLVYSFGDSDYTVATTAIAEVALDSGAVTRLPVTAPVSFLRRESLSPSGERLAVLTPDARLSVISLVDRSVRDIGPIQPVIVDSTFTGSDLFTSPYWAPDADRLAFIVNDRPYVLDFTSGKNAEPRALGRNLRALKWDRNTPLAFSRDGRWLAGPLLQNDELQAVFLPVDGGDGKLVTVLSGLQARNIFPGEAIGATFGIDMLRSSSNRLWQPRSDQVLLQYPDHSRQEVVVVAVDRDTGEHKEVQRRLTSQILLGAPGDRTDAIVLHESAAAPRNFRRMSRTLEVGEPLLSGARKDPVIEQVQVDHFSMRVADAEGKFRVVGTTVVRPASLRNSRAPAVVCIYPGASKSASIRRYAFADSCTVPTRTLLAQGIALVLVDILDQPTAGVLSGEYVRARTITDNLLPQVYRAEQLGYIDIEKLVVMGTSQGSFAALQVVSSTALFRGAIGLSGVRFAPNSNSFGWRFDKDQLLNSIGFTSDLAEVFDNSPYLRARKIDVPVFLAHGEADAYPIAASALMADALTQVGKQVEFARYPGEGHVIDRWTESHRADLLRRIGDFLKSVLQ
ncbi:S9 family peptidase [Peristeroidobacter soli]|uniref:S9 family peptidase n=1 Tax=Peristeroidobacter soli TaxID=2497877 RepID=UPI00101DE833|nr:LpqB family beta-propeller domain-containing protein [Peristeroidobacter soli]